MSPFATLVLGLVLGAEPAAEPPLAGRPLGQWLEDLTAGDLLRREEAVEVLGRAGPAAREAVPLLEKMLRGQPLSLRTRAALALWRIDGRTRPAVEALAETVRSGSCPAVRLEAMKTLRELGEDAAPAVSTLLDLADVDLEAAETLGDIGKPALPDVLRRLGDKDARQRRRAVTAL